MKKLIFAFGIVLLSFGCDKNDTKNKYGAVMEPINTVALGETCGGAERIKCQSGLECNEKNPTKTGQCITLSEKDIECSQEQKLVCAIKDNNKNGYLNPCEADRHGAEVLYEGLCKPTKNVEGDCKAVPVSVGNCEAFFSGAFFNQDTSLCEEVGLPGCSAEIPFTDVAKCQNACEQ